MYSDFTQLSERGLPVNSSQLFFSDEWTVRQNALCDKLTVARKLNLRNKTIDCIKFYNIVLGKRFRPLLRQDCKFVRLPVCIVV